VKEYTGRFGVMTRPRPGELVNGDAVMIIDRGVSTLIAVIDGLGHGSGAHQAAEAAKDAIGEWDGEPPVDLIPVAHEALRSTRGAVIGIAVINEGNNTLQYAGVGNIEARVVRGEQTLSPISTYGTLGARLGTIKGWSCEWGGSTLIMTSDGLSSSWSLDSYPGLLLHSPQLIAAVLMRDNVRDSDDATVVVAR
jgi:serine/threonine protein phosphatase PrpC